MDGSARKDVPRLVSNFARLGVNLLMGLILVPVLFKWLGNDWYALFQLVFGSVGLALLFEDVTRSSMIRETARSYHANDKDEFRKVYSTVFGLSIGAALLSSTTFVALWILIPSLNIGKEMHGPARTLVVAQGVTSFFSTLLTPTTNMFVITFRFIADNVWQVLRRSSYVISACICAYVLKIKDPAEGFRTFVLGANAISLLSIFASAAQIIVANPKLTPTLRWFDRPTLKAVWPTVMWNTLVSLAMNLYERTSGVLMNLAFGLHGNAVWGPAIQLSSYVRMASLGVNSGIDAVSAKISIDHGEKSDRMRSLVRYATVLHALVALPLAALIFGLAEPIVHVWIGRKIENPDTSVPQVALLTQILLIPVTARAISDCWARILYGAGFIARYARMVLLGGAINPILAWTLVKLAPVPESMKLYIPAMTLAAVFSFFHFLLLPLITARCLQTRKSDIFAPLVRPLIAGGISLAFLFGAHQIIERYTWTAAHLAMTGVGFAVVYATLTLSIGLTPSQRRTLLGVVRRKAR